MQKIIHAHKCPKTLNFIQVIKVYQEIPYDLLWPGREKAKEEFMKAFSIKEWEGFYFIDEEPTEEKLKKICEESPIKINKYFPNHKGIAYLCSATKTKPIKVSFKGSGPLKFKGKNIE